MTKAIGVAVLAGILLAACASDPPVTTASPAVRLTTRLVRRVCDYAASKQGMNWTWSGAIRTTWSWDNKAVEGFRCDMWYGVLPAHDGWAYVDICDERADEIREAREMLEQQGLSVPIGCERGVRYARGLELPVLIADYRALCEGPEPHAIAAQCREMLKQLWSVRRELEHD